MNIENNVVDSTSAEAELKPWGSLKHYDILKTLGHGHFSVVYSARNRFHGVDVALKKVEVRKSFDKIVLNREIQVKIEQSETISMHSIEFILSLK